MNGDSDNLKTLSIFHYVVAGVSYTFMPFETVLGVFTIIVLMRDSVKELFNGRNFRNTSVHLRIGGKCYACYI